VPARVIDQDASLADRVGAAIVTYLLLSTSRGRASRYTQTVMEPAVAGNGR
jgi:hypothetical protein